MRVSTGIEIFSGLFIGSVVLGAAGFGFGMVAMGLLSFSLTVKESTVLVLGLSMPYCGIPPSIFPSI
jgi:hypothetical protein